MNIPFNISVNILGYGPYSHGYWGIKFDKGNILNHDGKRTHGHWAIIELSLGRWRRWDGYQMADNVSLVYGLRFQWGKPQEYFTEEIEE